MYIVFIAYFVPTCAAIKEERMDVMEVTRAKHIFCISNTDSEETKQNKINATH